MTNMFSGATNFNQPLATSSNYWNVANVQQMAGMFHGASNFNQDISSWKVLQVQTMEKMLTATNLSPTNYNALLASRSALAVQENVELNAAPAQYGGCNTLNAQNGIAGRATLTAPVEESGKGWTITDGGLLSCTTVRPFITTRETPLGIQITLPTNGAGYDYEVNWNYADDPENFT
jgi:hypothetical protein